MTYSSYTDEQILDEIHRLRKQLDRIRIQLETGKGAVEHDDLRSKMSQLNLLKLEAKKRGVSIEDRA
ncbi:MAG: hypothetical protein JXR73_02930 [Candidatus Omnitrophica bacterium]|nr:hypothetical protein [Candidatus Omnitrophota bacterium]